MQFTTPTPLPLTICANCHATGSVGFKRCLTCRGLAAAYKTRGRILYWNFPFERYSLALGKARIVFNKIRLATLLIVLVNFWVWAGFIFYRTGSMDVFIKSFSLNFVPSSVKLLFWLGVATACYAYYRHVRENDIRGAVEQHNYGHDDSVAAPEGVEWLNIRKFSKKSLDICSVFTEEARLVLAKSYALADSLGVAEVLPVHIFLASLSNNRVGNLFIRLGFNASSLEKQCLAVLGGKQVMSKHAAPSISDLGLQVVFHSYEAAYKTRARYVSVSELLLSAVAYATELQEFLFALGIDERKLTNVVEWLRIREKLQRDYSDFRQMAGRRSKHGMDKAMTAVATPYLNQFSEDVTLSAQLGKIAPCVARDKELEEIFQVVDGGQQHVVLVGDFGAGKRSIVEGIATRMIEDDVPKRLQDKRLVRLSNSTLLSGATPAEAIERLMTLLYEVNRAGNIILVIHNIHELMGVSSGGSDSLDVAGTLAESLVGGGAMVIATTTTESFSRYFANSKLSTLFSKVSILEMSEDQAIKVLESKVGYIEYKNQVFFAYNAIEKAVQLAARFLRDVVLPGSALQVLSEAAIFTRNHKGINNLVTAEEVGAVVAEKTNIPVNTITADESTKLLHLEEALHNRVVGQNEAVTLVSSALRRARAEIRSTKKPIASFLFMGPTGVGKTELAKTIAEVYFGGENKMVRLDMSEYQDKNSIYRLIGQPGQKGSGMLTETIHRQPFSLLLLDEIEKADPDILNLFLQVLDDGRLTDSTGRVVDFTNVIIIATSNAGTGYVSDQIKKGLSDEIIKDRLLHGELGQYFKPEFLNRFDGIVLFKQLDKPAVKEIARLLLQRIIKDMDAKGIELRASETAIDFLANLGFDPEFGARPLRRVLQERVENSLAELLLSGKLSRRDVAIIGDQGEVFVNVK